MPHPHLIVETSPAGYRWLREVFEPTIAMIPAELRGKLEPAEMYHELLEHRWYLSEQQGEDVGLEEATRSYADTVLKGAPAERTLLAEPEAVEGLA